MQEREDLLLVDKPKGITSFDVIRRLRRELGVRKMGHAGTLDPLASGLMIIGIGEGTKKLSGFLKLPKTYEAAILLGEQTTTGDREGECIAETAVPDLPEPVVQQALAGMVGTIELPVPAHSAIKQGGVALYKKARSGERVMPPIKPMVVTRAELCAIERRGPHLLLRVIFDVGSGTYIRSLAEALGTRLGYPARLEDLRRTAIGPYRIEDARPL